MSIAGKKLVFVAMSGGVDSSVAALLLKKQGYDVAGVFMRCWGGGNGPDASVGVKCSVERDASDARLVAEKLGIPFYVWDFEEEYKKRVVNYMIDGYRQGITPNPDVMCNREIKFGLFFNRAMEIGADYVATGHYVRREPEFSIINDQFSNKTKRIENLGIENSLKIENCKLKIAKDGNKDQSYFLWTLTQEKLRHCLFPIGDYLKSEVREIAREAGLPTAEKKDSQGICFLGKVKLDEFLKQYIPEKKGAVLSVSGEKIGEHKGAHFYTIGQRHLGIANRKSRFGRPERLTVEGQIANSRKDFRPVYVAEKDIATNTLVVAEGSDNPALYKKELTLTGVNFVTTQHPNILENVGVSGMNVFARVRYRQKLSKALFIIHNSLFGLVFDEPVKFVAPGQSAVFYTEKGEMLGGGVITSSER